MSRTQQETGDDRLDLGRIVRLATLRTVCWSERVGSTNDLALAVARSSDVALPALFVAEHQSRGRGRGSNRWWSSAGALTFSLLIDPYRYQLDPDQWTRIALASAVAICQTIDPLLPPWIGPARIRWPNDVYLKDRKVAGILVENTTARGNGQPGDRRLVVGIGLNVNNSVQKAPAELRQRAVALCDVVGHELDLTGLLERLLRAWFEAVHLLGQGELELARFWQARADLVGEPVELTTPAGPVKGLCCGIAQDGTLLLRTAQGPTTCATGWNLRRCYG